MDASINNYVFSMSKTFFSISKATRTDNITTKNKKNKFYNNCDYCF